MAGIKSLAKDTAIYGISSIVGRFLNWCLVPLYTNLFAEDQYGVVTFIYSIVALLYIILTYGMETGFFRFSNHERWTDPTEVYTTSLISLATTSLAFIVAVAVLLQPISGAMQCADHQSFVMMMAVCVAIDAFTAIPFSYLRQQRRPMRFAALKLVNIGLNIGLNLFFLVLCPLLGSAVSRIFPPEFGIGYIFLSNLIASAVNLLLMRRELTGIRYKFNPQLLREMLRRNAPRSIFGYIYDPDGITREKLDWIMQLKNEYRGRIREYIDEYPTAKYVEGAKPWFEKADIALPCATQNELNEEAAKALVANGVIAVAEGANMPTTPEAIKVFQDAKILYSPGKASNAGGVSVSGLEMTQNSERLSWTAEEVDAKLLWIMENIHEDCVKYGTEADGYVNYVKGANVAGFMKVAKAMMAQGVV